VTKGYPKAKYKAFPTEEAAARAFQEGPDPYWGKDKFISPQSQAELTAIGEPVAESICVDAAWNTETKQMEYQGVWFKDKSLAFGQGPFENATNNIGEFLAIVHALGMLSKKRLSCPIYSDSQTAIAWVRNRAVRSNSMAKEKTSDQINNLVKRALTWLNDNEYANKILKWETAAWGENPADFGRK
jgi:ribonuclease HI